MINLMQGDCLDRMKEIPDGSVDMVLADPPYGTVGGMGKGEPRYQRLAQSEWDLTIDTQAMFDKCNRVLRTNGALILFSQEPYTSHLITNAHGNLPFSYRMVWLKDHFANSLIAKKAPVNYTEDICVFFKKYDTLAQHPLRGYAKRIMSFAGLTLKEINAELGHRKAEHFFYVDSTQFGLCTRSVYEQLCCHFCITREHWFIEYDDLKEIDRRFARRFNLPDGKRFKPNVLQYKKDYTGLHPTQKPVLLMEDLIKTYTNEGETVLDFTMGSGTTGVAAKNLGRSFIGIELDETYFGIAKERINDAR